MRVADYIADFIRRIGVKDVFMLSGGGSIYLDDGLACNQYLNTVCVRNEATAPVMAKAYAQLTGNLGVVYVTTGPGGANAVSGLCEAWVDSAPVMVISGQVQRAYASSNVKTGKLRSFGTQELDIVTIVKSITKYAEIVNDPNDIRYHLEKAVYLAKSGRPGPVWLDIPLDIQAAEIDVKRLKKFKPKAGKKCKQYLISRVDKTIQLLKRAKRPLIIAGQGIKLAGAVSDFIGLLKRLNIPVVFSRLGQDILAYSHPNAMGHGGMKGRPATGIIMQQSDLILSLGSRLSVPFLGEKLDAFSKDTKVIMVDIDKSELRKPTIKINLPCWVDVKIFIRKLTRKLKKEKKLDFSTWLEACQGEKSKYPIIGCEKQKNPIDLYYFVSRLDALSGRHHILVDDAGSSYYATGQSFTFEHGQREITSGAFAAMGVAIPQAIGASFADKKAQVLAVTGDGSLELNIQELKTMSYYQRDIKLFVINNGGYVSIRNTQDRICSGRYIGSDQAGCNEILDFRKVAAAFDLSYCLIEDCEKIDQQIGQIITEKGPMLIEVVCDNKQKIIEPIKEMN
jgi:acetolactate synthase-1/2/3 large subunit